MRNEAAESCAHHSLFGGALIQNWDNKTATTAKKDEWQLFSILRGAQSSAKSTETFWERAFEIQADWGPWKISNISALAICVTHKKNK